MKAVCLWRMLAFITFCSFLTAVKTNFNSEIFTFSFLEHQTLHNDIVILCTNCCVSSAGNFYYKEFLCTLQLSWYGIQMQSGLGFK